MRDDGRAGAGFAFVLHTLSSDGKTPMAFAISGKAKRPPPTIKANVARSEDEAELQSQGIDILKQAAEEEAKAIAGEGFQEELDPDRELGDLPAAEEDEAEEASAEDAAEGEENA